MPINLTIGACINEYMTIYSTNILISQAGDLLLQLLIFKLDGIDLIKQTLPVLTPGQPFTKSTYLPNPNSLYKLYWISDYLLIQNNEKMEAQSRYFYSSELVNSLKSYTTCSKK